MLSTSLRARARLLRCEKLDLSVEYFTKKIDDHLYKEMELMVEMYEAPLTDEEWVEIRESMLAHPMHEIVKILRSGRSRRDRAENTEVGC